MSPSSDVHPHRSRPRVSPASPPRLLAPGLLCVLGTFGLAAPAASQGADYSDPSAWLCSPGQADACDVDQRATVILADGAMRIEEWSPASNPPIDCFYVYPTVSQEPSGNSSLTAGPGEVDVAARQFARFAAQCRTFAPLYRQMTLAGLRAGLAGAPIEVDREMPYTDVRAAWNHYLQHHNQGRGVVLIGHSQGSSVLTRLIREEIDGKPVQDRIVSALLLGWNIAVPEGTDVGGDFESFPLCRARTQTGCLVAYVSFRETLPPPAATNFGRLPQPGMQVACVHPGALSGGRSGLNAYLSADRPDQPAWVTPERRVTTPFVQVPGLLSAECVRDEHGSYLSVRIAEESGTRTKAIGGDVLNPDGSVNAAWGLHLIDVALGMGDLLDLVEAQTRSYIARR